MIYSSLQPKPKRSIKRKTRGTQMIKDALKKWLGIGPMIGRDSVFESDHRRSLDSHKFVRFTVYFANGGKVVETYRVDRNHGKEEVNMYIVTSEQDFGSEVNKILTMEGLRF